jgi:cytoskeletal protein RodZ
MADGFAAKTPGQQLREAREAKGADLQAAHEGTKIPLRLLEAMERDEYHKVSGPLYVRSFLRNYAGWLGVDTDAVLRAYEALAGSAEGGDEDPTWSEETVEVKRVGSPGQREIWIGAAVVILVIVAALVVWRLMRDPDPDAVPATGAMTSVPAETVAAAPAETTRTEEPAADRAVAQELPVPWPASESVPLRGDTPRALVLRVLLPAPANCSVRCDDQPAARPVVWPDEAQPLPDRDIDPGRAYAVSGGYAIYWGADDTFTLTLGDLDGASAMLNGVALPVARWQQGQPVVLDRHTLERMDG